MKKFYLFLILAFSTLTSMAQIVAIDSTFDPGTGFNNNNNVVYATALQLDGKIIVGGLFTSYNSTARKNIVRLNSDGSIDTTFDPGTGFDNTVYSIAIQADGKIIVGGVFTSFNGTWLQHIARLNSDGTIDATFNSGLGFNGHIRSIVIQPDGKILAGGDFGSYQNTNINYIARLNSDGSIDASFLPLFDSDVYLGITSIVLQPDGKILTGGNFISFNGISRRYIARLNTDGTLDTAFDPGTGFSGQPVYANVSSIVIQSDGKIVIAGDFDTFNGTSRNYITRLNTDGSLDSYFEPGTGFDNPVASIALQTDGKIIAGGNFTYFNGTSRYKFTRINVDGSVDVTFDPSYSFNAYVRSIVLQPDGKIIVGGDFILYNGTSRKRIARLINNNGNSVGIIEKEIASFTIYPNPASELINIEFTSPINLTENMTFEITNILGQIVFNSKVETKNINIQNLKNGTYFVKVGNITKKFIKE